jgi:hypothetical protein
MSDPLYDPRKQEKKPEYLPLELVPHMAQRAARLTSPLETFRIIYLTAIEQGMTSEQEISKVIGRDGLDKLRSQKSDPSPALRRLVLTFIATLDPEKATMKKEPWRHASPRPREERVSEPQP